MSVNLLIDKISSLSIDSSLKEEFQRAYGVFQRDGLAIAANYSVLNFQTPNKEWKKVEFFF